VLLDGDGKWLAPGLIDSHVHLFLAADAQPLATFLASSDEEKFATAIRNASTAIRAGITTVRDCGGPSALVRAFRNGPARGNSSPHLIASGSPLTRPNGHCHFMGIQVASAAEVRAAVQQLFAEENDFIKIMASGGGLTPGTRPADADFPYELMCEAVALAHSNGKTVAAHCHATESIRRAMRAGVDVIEHASFIEGNGQHRFLHSVCEEIRDHGIAICPTVSGALRTADAFSKNGSANKLDVGAVARLRARVTNTEQFYKVGIKLLAGTDSGITQTPFDSLVDELLAHRQAGMSAAEALRSATSESAKILRLEKVGEARIGYRADLILLIQDPLQDIEALRRPQSVLKAGKVVFSRVPQLAVVR
jgi:imidazolonepropionase-like amidohydrolase